MDYLSPELISKSIGFHGQPLQKIWEGERGENDLLQIGVVNPDFSAYQSRQKYFSFQDRAKRLKLHQFISKNANTLYSAKLVEEVPRSNFNDWVGPGKNYILFLNNFSSFFFIYTVSNFYCSE